MRKNQKQYMAKFSHYYLQYDLNDLFAQEYKAKRQEIFGEMLENDKSISFILGEGENLKHYKHTVRHLRINHNIIVMRIANDSKKEVIQDFKALKVIKEILVNRVHKVYKVQRVIKEIKVIRGIKVILEQTVKLQV